VSLSISIGNADKLVCTTQHGRPHIVWQRVKDLSVVSHNLRERRTTTIANKKYLGIDPNNG
jgi:hypothetical protein